AIATLEQTQRDAVQRLLALNLTPAQIAAALSLTVGEVERLRTGGLGD
ncbi:MAG: hypothetical protein HC838_12955, partial [Spirulinaceae cyanobacterium RM2_2_10]|nr:hypothetical protein [Spirulinaceae cyanobacterium RM2_2_10]